MENNNFNSLTPVPLKKYGKLSFPKRFNILTLVKRGSIYAVLIFITLCFVVPYLWLLASSLKTVDGFSSTTFSLLPLNGSGELEFVFNNYVQAWNELNIPQVLLNTLIVCVVNTALNLFPLVDKQLIS